MSALSHTPRTPHAEPAPEPAWFHAWSGARRQTLSPAQTRPFSQPPAPMRKGRVVPVLPVTPDWPKEKVHALYLMRRDGMGPRAIGDILGVSRAAVIGKANRLGLGFSRASLWAGG